MKKEIIFLLSLCFISLKAQELLRRPLLGIRMVSLTAETQRVMNLPDHKGVLVEKVIANSTEIVMEYKAVQTVNGMQRLIVSRPPDNRKRITRSPGQSLC